VLIALDGRSKGAKQGDELDRGRSRLGSWGSVLGGDAERRHAALSKAWAGCFAIALAVVIGLLLAASSAEGQPKRPAGDVNAMIFVHGFSGSGAQFESQGMRFESNGYPGSYIEVLDYDSTFATETREQVHARLDQLIAELQERTGRPQVDVLGHSLGTSVMQDYLNSSAQRAANVARYVNVDGRQADAPPGGVPTLAIWAGRGDPDRSIEGAKNVTIPNQTHVQVATSAEAFAEYHEFFTGKKPRTTRIVRERGEITIAGRAVIFPHNRGNLGTTLEVWEVDGATGHRTGAAPVASMAIGVDGDWGPVTVEPGTHYELALTRDGVQTLHYYYEPFLRSDHLIRLLDSEAIKALAERSEGHVGMLILRYKELWGDQGSESDVLTIDGTSVCNPATCPISMQVNAVFAFDRFSDGNTDLSSPHPVLSRLPFVTGIDIFVPAARPPTRTVTVGIRSRGKGPERTVRFPNFPSSTDGVIVQLNDFEQR
jgi:pimeloyl-ACP methyl ester carboxylesterase